MSIYEYDQARHIRQEREEAWEDGKREGEQSILRRLIQKKLDKGMSVAEIADVLEESEERIRELLQ